MYFIHEICNFKPSSDLCEPGTPKISSANPEGNIVTSTPIVDKPAELDDSVIVISDSDDETSKPSEQNTKEEQVEANKQTIGKNHT